MSAKFFNPIADRMIREIEADKGKKLKRLKPGQPPPLGSMVVFSYSPKYKSTLPYYDKFPASIVIKHYDNGFGAVNTHYLPWAKRLNLAERMLRATKNKNRITWKKIKKAFVGLQLPLGYAHIIYKRYLYGHITSKWVYIFTFEDYKKFLMDVPPKFQKKSDATVWKLTVAAFNDHAKKLKKAGSKKKPKFTNVKKKK